MKQQTGSSSVIGRIEQITAVRAVRSGLTNMIPILIIGAFALIFQTFPAEGYQQWIAQFAGGALLTLFNLIYEATFGVLSVYMTISISWSYMKVKADPESSAVGAVSSSILSFFLLAGSFLPTFSTENMGPKSMFLALITGLGASALYQVLERLFRRPRNVLFSTGANQEFNRMLAALPAVVLVAVIFALFNLFIIRTFPVDSFHRLLIRSFNHLFAGGHTGFLKGFCFVLLSSVLWFFGIHGSDTLEGVMQTYFAPGLAANKAAALAGKTPEVVLTKDFFDCFVLMGGCGATICLLITILLFSRNRARRGLGLAAAFPMIFNINELMVFGLPIILNPVMLIPFLLTPLVCYTTSYLAISLHLVPAVIHDVAWTTPILLGGCHATGSLAGSALQLVNVILGVLIYLPFVRLLDRQSAARARESFDIFTDFFKENEAELSTQRLLDRGDVYGDFAKGLCAEMRHDMNSKDSVVLAYQPQYHHDGRCVGVEALLRWKHPVHGFLYPPLVIKLAEEGGFLADLEEAVLTRALADRPKVLRRFGPDVKISINVTGATVVTARYQQFCRNKNAADPFRGKHLCLEVTEQAALSFNQEILRSLHALRDMGLMLAIDDFSMGQTSLHYLKDNLFDLIKLDGSLIRELFSHQNSREIIASVVHLASDLEMQVLAEYVENEEQRDFLHEIGCDLYQGYLYSPAVFLSEQAE